MTGDWNADAARIEETKSAFALRFRLRATGRLSANSDLGKVFGRLRPGHFEGFHGGNYGPGNDVVAIPVPIGGNDMPARQIMAGMIEHVFVSLNIIIPTLPGFDVCLVEFPVF